MRLDKFLKLSRLIKRRTLAKQMCDNERITVNDKAGKAGTQVSVGDTLVIRFGHKELVVRVERLKENTRKEEADTMYTILSEQSIRHEKDDLS